MSEQTRIKFLIDIQGDYSVGIPDFCSNVTIEDDGIYSTKEDLEELRAGVKTIYGEPSAAVVTELEFFINSLREKELEESICFDQWNEINSVLTDNDTETELVLYKAYRSSQKDISNLKIKIAKLKESYDKMGLWYEGKAKKTGFLQKHAQTLV